MNAKSYREFKSVSNDTLPIPLYFARYIGDDGRSEYAQVRLCVSRHRGLYIDHFNRSYTYTNGIHIDVQQDGILGIEYVDTYSKLRSISPSHHLLPENRS
jgi:hypothetical protein